MLIWEKFRSEMEKIYLSINGRLGNNISQIISAILYCNCAEVREIIYFLSGSQNIGSIFTPPYECELPSGIKIKFSSDSACEFPRGPSSHWNFDPGQDGDKPHVVSEFLPGISPLAFDAFIRDTEFFGELMLRMCERTTKLFSANLFEDHDVALLHLRGEDIFGTDPHPNYPQPPLSYYQGVASYLFHQKKISRIILMPQDNFNPVVSPLWNSLKDLSDDVSIDVMSVGLIESVILLLRSTHIVNSQGTFSSCISLLSSRVKAFISFRNHCGLIGHLDQILSRKGVKSICVLDNGMRYTPVGSWSNLESQTSLMLKYPLSFLDFEEEW